MLVRVRVGESQRMTTTGQNGLGPLLLGVSRCFLFRGAVDRLLLLTTSASVFLVNGRRLVVVAAIAGAISLKKKIFRNFFQNLIAYKCHILFTLFSILGKYYFNIHKLCKITFDCFLTSIIKLILIFFNFNFTIKHSFWSIVHFYHNL